MMKSVVRMLAIAVSTVVLSIAVASAAVPQTVSYQGYLQSSSGAPVNSTVSMTFGLYTAPTGTSAPLWAETQNDVNVANGVYSVQLGSVTPMNLPFDQQYWMGIAIGSDPEMTPRQPLASVPYAIRSGCTPGDYIGCYSGAPGTRDKGVCKGGVRTCRPDGTGFGTCEGEILPSPEVCYNQLDEDCDGVLDTGCAPRACTPDTTRPCYTGPPATQGVGACHAGVETCNQEGSGYGACVGQVLPQTEVCDGMDNNCDGIVDEGSLCQAGQACIAGACQSTTPQDGTPCDDGNLCTVSDVYQSGVCVGVPKNCSDGVACTVDACNPGTGACTHTPVDALCNDGNWCNGVEFCNPAAGCQAGTPPNCDDSNPCTIDMCNSGGGCAYPPADDGTPCGSGLFCQAGVCTPM